MATVYLAEDLRHGRRVAIKVLRPDLAAVIGADRFLREIRTIAALQHPHILGLIDSGEVNGTAYYVMPYVSGESLRDRLSREKQLPVADAVRIATEVAGALDYAHRQGVIHRDIKPENILLHEGQALVADFGIALAVTSAGSTRMTETGMSLGTPHYMSPEQAMGEREITGRSDVYALGAMTYEMLSGDPPFTGSTAQAIVARVMTETPRPLLTQRHTVPPQVEAAVLTALEKLPADRFATAGEFARALNAESPRAAAARDASEAEGAARVRRPGARAMPVGWAGLAMLAAGVLLVGAAGWALGARGRGASGGTMRLMLSFPDAQEPRLSSSLLPMLALSPDGRSMIYSGPGQSARTQLWVRHWDQLGASRLAQTVDDACCVAFSPSGDSIAYLAPPHLLRVLPLRGGVGRVVADSGVTSVSDFGGGVTWADDGMLYVSGLDGLLRVRPAGGPPELAVPLDSARGDVRYLWPVALPGSRGVLVSVIPRTDPNNYERIAIGVADLRNGTVTTLVQGLRAIWSPSGHLVYARPDGRLHALPFDPEALRITGAELALPDTLGLIGPSLGDFTISPTGVLAYNRGGVQYFRPVWVDRNGGVTELTDDLTELLVDTPALSPDGRDLIVSLGGIDGNSHIWRKPLDGGRKTRLTFDGTLNWRPVWRPGTTSVWFVSTRESDAFRLFEMDTRRPGAVQRTVVGVDRPVSAAAVSPDGQWLIVRTDDQAEGAADILALRPGIDTIARPLVATPAEEMGPSVSPDGRWLAYTSNKSGRREVYIQPFPDARGALYQVSFGGGIMPRWSPRGDELFYVDGQERMITVPVGPGPGLQLGEQRPLFDVSGYQLNPFAPQYDVTADGRRFVMVRSERGTAANVVVVFGFGEELGRE